MLVSCLFIHNLLSSVKAATVAPSQRPTFTPQYYPTLRPTVSPSTRFPTASPKSFTCGHYSAKNTDSANSNYKTCQFVACTGQYVQISGCGACDGDQLIKVYVENDQNYPSTYDFLGVADDDCDSCSAYSFTATTSYGADVCMTYTIQEGCYSDLSCSGTLSVSGASYCVNCPSNTFKLSGGDIASIVLCTLYAIILAAAAAASYGYISLSFLVVKSLQEVKPIKPTEPGKPDKWQQIVANINNPIIQPAQLGEDIEHPQQTAVVSVQPTGKTSLQQVLVLNEAVTMGNFASSTEVEDGSYQVFIPSKDRNLFSIPGLKVNSQIYGLVNLATQIFTMLFFLMSYIFAPDRTSSLNDSTLIMFIYHVVVSWIAVPIWQNYSIVDKEQRNINCEGTGCIYCRACGISCLLCSFDSKFVERTDKSCRYIPLSLYNLFYMIRYPGWEINYELPADMEEFGFGRGYFLLFSLNVRGTLNGYIFINAVLKVVIASLTEFSGSTLLAILSVCFATVNLKVYLLSLYFGLYFLPFTCVVMLMMCCTDHCEWIERLKSKKGTNQYENFLWAWESVKKY